MIEKDKLINIVKTNLTSSLCEILNGVPDYTIEMEVKYKILNKISETLKNNFGDSEYEKFCKYLGSRNMTLFIDNKDNVLLVCFYNGIIFVKIEEIIEDYYKFLLGDIDERL